MSFLNLLDHAFALRLTITLLHFLWQGTLVALVAVLASHVLRRTSAQSRYLLNVTALLLMAMCVPLTFARVSVPVFTAGELPADPQGPASLHAGVSQAEARTRGGAEWGTGLELPRADVAASPVPDELPAPTSGTFIAQTSAEAEQPILRIGQAESAESGFGLLLRRCAPYVTFAYFAGVLLLSVRLLRGAAGGRRLGRVAMAIQESELLQRVHAEARRFRLSAAPTVKWCADVSVPAVMGVVRPVILLPASAATGLSLEQLQAVIAHELAHIRRHDLAINLLQRVIEALLFFHPAVWWSSRHVSREREQACDQLVLSAGYERARYADALLRMAELSWTQRRRPIRASAHALAADGATPTEFKRRILHVLDVPQAPHLRPGRIASLVVLVAMLAAVAGPAAWLHFQVPALAQTQPEEEQADKTLAYFQSLQPDSEITEPETTGRRLAEADIAAERTRILYCGKPWSAGKPLIDDETGYRVEIMAGCTVSRNFVRLLDAYNSTMREHFTAAIADKTLAEQLTDSVIARLREQSLPLHPGDVEHPDYVQTFAAERAAAHEPNDPAAEEHDKSASGALNHTTLGNSIKLEFSPDDRRLAVMNGNPTRTMFQDGRSVAEDWRPTVDVIDTETGNVAVSLDLSDLPLDPNRPVEEGPTFIEATAIAFSPDGATLAVGTSVGQLLMFNAETGTLLRSLDDQQERLADENVPDFWKQLPRVMGGVKSIAFSPDGKLIAVCGESFADWRETLSRVSRLGLRGTAPGRLKVFDVATGELKFNPAAHSNMAVDVAYSPDGRYLASAGRWMDSLENHQFGDGVILWDAQTGERKARIDLELRGWMYDAKFSPDGKRILVGAQDFDEGGGNGTGVAAMLSADTLAVLWRRPITRSAMAVAFYPQEAAVIVLTDREKLSFIEADTGKTLMALRAPQSDPPQKEHYEDFAISPQGHVLAMGIVEKGQGHVHFLRMGKRDAGSKEDCKPAESAEGEFSEPTEVIFQLPEWMKPLYNHGLLATVDEHGHVHTVTVGNIMTDELLSKIGTLPELREFDFQLTEGLTPQGLAHLGQMSRLERLCVSRDSDAPLLGDEVIRHVADLRSLRELTIIECGVTGVGAKLLEQMTQLRSLSLSQEGRLTDEALKSIGTMTELTSLSLNSYVGTERLGWMRFSASGIRELRGLRNLRSLHLVGQEVPADSLDFPELTSLSLGHAAVDDSVAVQVSKLRALRSLELVYCHIGDTGLEAIASLPDLRRLDLSSNSVSDAGIEHFAGHKHLEHISLRAEGVSDRSLEHIARIPSLTRLDLYGSGRPGVSPGRNFSPAGLAHLKRLPSLESLWLTNFQLDGGYTVLSDLQQLREITMVMCDITDQELETLEEALPNTRISHATGGGRVVRRSAL